MKVYWFLCVLCALALHLASAQTAKRNDVVIDEIMADPTPVVALPDIEWIELRNTASFNINLAGWRIVKGTTQSGVFSNFILQPDSFVIVCTGSSVTAMLPYGPALAVTNFPSLNNDEDLIYLKSADNRIICAVNYNQAWYKNELKKSGGWTLEMTDTKNPCTGSGNWRASGDTKGGTPGRVNFTNALNPDDSNPRLLRAFAPDSLSLTLVFDEPLDSLKALSLANYNVSDGIGAPWAATIVLPLFDRVNLKLTSPMAVAKVYTVVVNSLTDCSGNPIGSKNIIKAGLSSLADSLDIVINEILFNPLADGVDYAEIYNRSSKIIDCKQLYIATRKSTGIISAIQQLSIENTIIFPGEFLVITEDPAIVKQKYLTTKPDAFVQLTSMPPFPDDKGDVIILNAQGKILDELLYYDKWHFELINNSEGVSLERIDYNAPSVQSNFHSAATSVGYGTPGYKNSQFKTDAQLAGEVTINPQVFSPDNDGTDDFATVNYSFPTQGFVASITIFDATGRPVRYLERNALCGLKGNFRWDGLGEKQQKLSQGIYIFFTEIFNTSGKKKQFKNTIVLARRS